MYTRKHKKSSLLVICRNKRSWTSQQYARLLSGNEVDKRGWLMAYTEIFVLRWCSVALNVDKKQNIYVDRKKRKIILWIDVKIILACICNLFIAMRKYPSGLLFFAFLFIFFHPTLNYAYISMPFYCNNWVIYLLTIKFRR